jgi:hypothetical protein
MQIRFTPNLHELKKELDNLREICFNLEHEQKSRESLLSMFEFEGFEKFKSEVLKGELERIAHKRMSIDVEEKSLHLRLEGQYAEVNRLMDMKKDLESEIQLERQKLTELYQSIRVLELKLEKHLK